ncbi:MAG: SRPBCC family protein [Vicinamibacterales bacterium]
MFRVHRLTTALLVPRPLDETFRFFADAGNLQRITPPWLDFRILTPLPIEMRPGALIEYRLRLRGMPIRWRTVIDAWEPPARFVDRQLRGPYLLWRHTHTFEPVAGGTLCRDQVDYRVLGGWPIERFFVRPELERIFTYRQRATLEAFGAPPDRSIGVTIR